METLKAESDHVIPNLPDSATSMNDITYRLYVIKKVREGRKAIMQGDSFSIEDLKREIESW